MVDEALSLPYSKDSEFCKEADVSVSTLTSKGQVTIPKDVRERLRLRTGDKLDFQVEEDGTIRVHPIAARVSEVFGLLAEKASRSYSVEEMDAGLRDAFRKDEPS